MHQEIKSKRRRSSQSRNVILALFPPHDAFFLTLSVRTSAVLWPTRDGMGRVHGKVI